MKRSAVLTLTLLVLCGRDARVGQRIARRVDETCQNARPCLIRIKDLTEFEWGRMYAFDAGVEPAEIERVIGTSYPDFVQFRRRLIFLRGGRVVHSENQSTDIEGPVEGEVRFYLPGRGGHRSDAPETAVFRAAKERLGGGFYYTLTPVK